MGIATRIDDIIHSLSPGIKEKFLALIEWFKPFEGVVVVSFSGGLDSSVVLAAATLAKGVDKVVAVTAVSPIRLDDDIRWAKTVVDVLSVKHLVFEVDELSNPNFVANPPNRCYICKKLLAGKLLEIAGDYGAEVIVDGTNASDLSDFRPGYLAFKEVGIRSPLLELGITKDEVRAVAKVLGLPNWGEQPRACLATRIPYGEPISAEKLQRIKEAERILKDIVKLTVVRVRDHGDVARIEVGGGERRKFFDESIMDRVNLELRKLGYRYVALDLQGYRSGSLNEALRK